MRESELHEHIYARSKELGADVLVGPGDDCAIVRAGGEELLLTVDQLVEGRHFLSDTPVELIARKAMARSVSDIAAMGGRPWISLATGLLPHRYPAANELFDQMHRWARHWDCPLVGGDIARHADRPDQPLTLTTTVIGRMEAADAGVTPSTSKSVARLRSAAIPGQAVWVTGRLGGSLASGRHLSFEPRLRAGLVAAMEANPVGAMIDLSDGLGRDAGRIARASGVLIEIDARLLPLHGGCGWREGMGDGEDYELLFTGAIKHGRGLLGDLPLTRIGRVLRVPEGQSPGCVVLTPEGERAEADAMGWDH